MDTQKKPVQPGPKRSKMRGISLWQPLDKSFLYQGYAKVMVICVDLVQKRFAKKPTKQETWVIGLILILFEPAGFDLLHVCNRNDPVPSRRSSTRMKIWPTVHTDPSSLRYKIGLLANGSTGQHLLSLLIKRREYINPRAGASGFESQKTKLNTHKKINQAQTKPKADIQNHPPRWSKT